jgi:hypothetical protein
LRTLAYIFERNEASGSWSEVTKLTASDRAGSDYFGYRVAINAAIDVAVVSSHFDDDNGQNSGSVYVYELDNDTRLWKESKLTASDGASHNWFGYSVALSDSTIFVGSPGNDGSGSVYVYEKNGNWEETTKLVASDGTQYDSFGGGGVAAAAGNRVIVGARHDDDKSGSAYVYEKRPGGWIEIAKLTAADGAASDKFGFAVAIANDSVLVGSPYDSDGANEGFGV